MDTSKIALYTNPDESFTLTLTPGEAILDMLAHTDESGTLFIPDWSDDYDPLSADETPRYLRCVMHWNRADADRLIAEHKVLCAAIEKLAALYPEYDEEGEPDAAALPDELRAVWETYLRPFDTGDVDEDVIADIRDRESEGVKKSDRSAEEQALCERYNQAIYRDAARRVGEAPASYDVVIRAMRLRRLWNLHPPEFILQHEATRLAEAMAIHAYGTELRLVDNVE